MENIKEYIGGTICMLLMVINFVGWAYIGRAWEDQKRCDNGATQFCYEEVKND